MSKSGKYPIHGFMFSYMILKDRNQSEKTGQTHAPVRLNERMWTFSRWSSFHRSGWKAFQRDRNGWGGGWFISQKKTEKNITFPGISEIGNARNQRFFVCVFKNVFFCFRSFFFCEAILPFEFPYTHPTKKNRSLLRWAKLPDMLDHGLKQWKPMDPNR